MWRHILRPDALESNFYAWRITGDIKYIDRSVAAVQSFQKYLKVSATNGYVGLMDVNDAALQRIDDTESFWYAEV
ncbi:glycoside hydrolase [Flammula alnicola]|nr:glycoside hydrolase [Flammula alnicola]